MDEGPVGPFFADLAARAGTAPLSDAEAGAVLDLTRVVAHTRERRLAPLTAYAAALAMDGLDEAARIARLRDLITLLAAQE
jgi:hypothetical protein